MPTCEVCDCADFFSQDGKFFCALCNTQSQVMQVEVKQEYDYSNSTQESNKLKHRVKREAKRKVGDFGRTWVGYEGYQWMLKALVDALIKMGFDQRLKEVVGQLWFAYLRFIGAAFCDDEGSGMEINTLKESGGRSLNVGLSMQLKKPKTELEEDDAEDDEYGIEDEDLQMSEDDADDSMFEEERCKKKEKKTNPQEKKRREFRNLLDMKHTLALCYLGLRWLKEPATLSDLIRWSREGHLPYHKASVILPETMKFSQTDNLLFCSRFTPHLHTVNGIAITIANKLNIPYQWDASDFKLVLASVIADLQFENVVTWLSWYLLDNIDFASKVTLVRLHYSIDAYVAAILIVSVKMVYILDGVMETNDVLNTRLIRALRVEIRESWKAWTVKHMSKAKRKLYRGIPRNENDLRYVHDVGTYVRYCSKEVFRNFANRPTMQPLYSRSRKYDLESQETYFKTLHTSAKELDPSIDLDGISLVPSSFPLCWSHTGEAVHESPKSESTFKTSPLEPRYRHGVSENEPCDSFKFLLRVVSERMELSCERVHKYVEVVEMWVAKNDRLNKLLPAV